MFILALFIYVIAVGVSLWLIHSLADLAIVLIIIGGAILAIFAFDQTESVLAVILIGLLAPMFTVPLWAASRIFTGSKQSTDAQLPDSWQEVLSGLAKQSETQQKIHLNQAVLQEKTNNRLKVIEERLQIDNSSTE